jgi:hypothetical protein
MNIYPFSLAVERMHDCDTLLHSPTMPKQAWDKPYITIHYHAPPPRPKAHYMKARTVAAKNPKTDVANPNSKFQACTDPAVCTVVVVVFSVVNQLAAKSRKLPAWTNSWTLNTRRSSRTAGSKSCHFEGHVKLDAGFSSSKRTSRCLPVPGSG